MYEEHTEPYRVYALWFVGLFFFARIFYVLDVVSFALCRNKTEKIALYDLKHHFAILRFVDKYTIFFLLFCFMVFFLLFSLALLSVVEK